MLNLARIPIIFLLLSSLAACIEDDPNTVGVCDIAFFLECDEAKIVYNSSELSTSDIHHQVNLYPIGPRLHVSIDLYGPLTTRRLGGGDSSEEYHPEIVLSGYDTLLVLVNDISHRFTSGQKTPFEWNFDVDSSAPVSIKIILNREYEEVVLYEDNNVPKDSLPLPPQRCETVDSPNYSPANYDLVAPFFSQSYKIILANSKTGICREILKLSGGLSSVGQQIAVSPSGDRIAYTSFDQGWQLYTMNLVDRRITHLATTNIGGQPSWNADGTMIAFISNNFTPDGNSLNSVDLQGNTATLSTASTTATTKECIQPTWSPTGSTLIYSDNNIVTGGTLYAVNTKTSQVKELFHFSGDGATHPVCDATWSHDGKQIAFRYEGVNGNWILARMNADGSNVETLAELTGNDVGHAQWSPDDMLIAFVNNDYQRQSRMLYTISVPNHALTELTTISGIKNVGHPQWSIDGSKIAFTTYDSDYNQIRVMAIASIGGVAKSIVLLGSTFDNFYPKWRTNSLM